MYNSCKVKGDIKTIPKTPGLVVWHKGHIGISIDGVWAIEAKGFDYGIVKTRIADRKWTNWGQLPDAMLDYVEVDNTPANPETTVRPVDPNGCPYEEPTQNLKRGKKGNGVRWVQWMLVACGYDVGTAGIDGDFGSATRLATRNFQKENGLTSDGIVGEQTRAKLKAVLAAKQSEAKTPSDEQPVPDDAENSPEVPPTEPEQAESAYAIRGKIADISKWQGEIDWTAAARELDFCILRAQYGHENIDSKYLTNAAGCEAMKIPYGAYSYCLFDDVETAREEARFFAERIKDTHPTFLVLDLEPGGVAAKDVREAVSAYVAELRALGYPRVGVYIAHHAYNRYNVDTGEVDFVWIPRYGTNNGKPQKQPAYPCDLWQYTSFGRLAGVKGRVDLNQ